VNGVSRLDEGRSQRRLFKYGFVIVTAALLAVSLLAPIYPREQTLQHAPTVIALAFMAIGIRKDWLSLSSCTCIAMFLWLHILGARYIYSFVPYDDWAIAVCGTSVSELFGWNRNHYDRVVHFLFGCLCIPPATEAAHRFGKLTRPWAMTFAVLVVLAVGALYEILEWLLTVVMAPRHAEAYNGQQGDMWDAQKDMALALAGALCVVVLMTARRHVRSR